MTPHMASRAQPNPAQTPAVLSDVIAMVTADQSLGAARRHDICSALRIVAKVLDRRPEEVPANPDHLRERLKSFTPAMAGLAAPRWRNILSLTRSALKRTGVAHMPARNCLQLSPPWADLIRSLKDRPLRIGLSRLASYASMQGVEPTDVDDRFMDRFRDDLVHNSLVVKPLAAHRHACVIWNRVAVANPALTLTAVAVPQLRDTYTLPWSSFSASLQVEVQAYLDYLAGKDILAERDFRPLRPASLFNRDFQLRQFASALVQRGRDPQSLRSLADLVATSTVKDGLRFFLERVQNKRTQQIHHIACFLTATARHWVKVDAAHLESLRRICRGLDPKDVGLTTKNRARLRQFDNPKNVQALLALPQRLVASASRGTGPTHAKALSVQTALMIEILIMMPIRIKNLASLELDRHILRGQGRGRSQVHLVIPGSETKNSMDFEAALPSSTVALLDLYLERYRPLLLDGSSSWLFPGRQNGPKSEQAIRSQIQVCLAAKCGVKVNPHLFRHIAAKIHLDSNPGAYGFVRLLMGHKSVETTTRFYVGMEGAAALEHYDNNILKQRAKPTAQAKSVGSVRWAGRK
jgi:integrase